MAKSKTKVMLMAFFDVRGIVHTEFLPQGQTINQQIYRDILQRLMRSVQEKRRQMHEKNHGCFHRRMEGGGHCVMAASSDLKSKKNVKAVLSKTCFQNA